MKLTKTLIDKLTYSSDPAHNKKCIIWADAPTGFGVRVYPSGKKSFVLDYRFEGQKQLKVLGRYGDITLPQAEALAIKDIALLLDNKSPLQEKRRQQMGETMGRLCQLYIERKASTKKTGDEDIRRINRHILPTWGNRKLKSIHFQDVTDLHAKIGQSAKIEANRVLALVSTLFTHAFKWGLLDAGAQNPAANIDKYEEQARDRFVSQSEMPHLIQAINEEPNLSARYALWLYLLTGLRKEEVLSAKWSDIDFNRSELRIANTKNSKVHYLPLSSAALVVLEKMPRAEDNPYIVLGHKPGAHLVNIDKPWQRVRRQAGIGDVHLHDLRRSVGSWMAQSGNSLHLIGRVLNHSNTSTTAIYARFAQDHVREALDRHGEQILQIGMQQPS